MAKKGVLERWARGSKFSSRRYHRCHRCGRQGAFYRRFGVCRICFRELASRGEIPGVTKASW
ncbi:MAG: type Z 30S ribosomal protein S14 [Candidatus Omnitrophica bacterium]|nr:type Z 30S ribosomal protein S14 [Candidatus Omnitrophota bacterium]